METNIISFNSIEYKYLLQIDGNYLFFKIESIYPKNIYSNHFSYEQLVEICNYFSLIKTINDCKIKIEDYIQKKYYTIKLEENIFIFHFDVIAFQFEIKLLKKNESLNLNYGSLPKGIKNIIDNKKLILGIDFGTTYSNASIVINNETIIIPNNFGKLATPSYISFIDDKKYYIGELAKLTPSFDHNTIYGIKRLIGRKYNENYYDKTIGEIKREYDFPFEIKKDSHSDKIKIVINYEKGTNKYTKEFFPEQLCAMLLKKIITDSEYYLSKKIGKTIVINNAVITVPAYFNQKQREAIKESAKIINLNVEKIINEPTAASLAYGYQKEANEKPNYILVVDFGGGTLDITILCFTKNENGIYCDITTSRGLSNLGGDDFDLELMKYCLREQKLNDKIDIHLSKNIRLKRACEEAKIELSTEEKTNIQLDDYQDSIDINIPITREIFNKECDKLFIKFENELDTILQNFKKNNEKSNISKIILIGGSTFIPKVRDIISKRFPGIEVTQNYIETLYSVSKGAAIFGAKILGLDDEKKIFLYDINNITLGVEILGGKMSPIVEKDSKFPFDLNQIYQTVKDNQTVADIRIYEGENPLVKDNFNLGNFSIKNLPKKPAGKAKIKINFSIDDDSCLNVKAYDLDNNNNFEEKKVEKPQLFKDEEIIMLMNEESNMKELNIENIKEYDFYKYYIQIEDKLENYKNIRLELINKLSNLIKHPYESLKIYTSFAKYYFREINGTFKKKKIEMDEDSLKKIKSNIELIFENIQFYDNNENTSRNISNYVNILNEMIDDLMFNNDLYYFCLDKLFFHYIEKVKSFLYSLINSNEQQLVNKSSYFLDKADKILVKLKAKEKNQLYNYKKMIKDLYNLIDIKKLRIRSDGFLIWDIKEIYYKYLGNSFLELKNEDDIQFLENLLPDIKSNVKKVEKFINEIRDKEKYEKCDDFEFITDPLFFILEKIQINYNNYDEKTNLRKLRDRLCDIKGCFGRYGIKDNIETIYEFLIDLKGCCENIISRTRNTLNNKIYVYLTKVIELIKKNK